MRAIRSIQYNLRDGGVRAVVRKAFGRAVALVHRSEEWVLLCRTASGGVPTDLPPGMTTAWLEMEDLRRHAFFKAVAYPEDMDARFRGGSVCLGIFVAGRLAHVSWMVKDELPLDPGLPTFPSEGAAGIYDMFTLDEFRRRGCQSVALRTLGARARQDGASRLVAVVHPGNRVSLSVFEKNGFERVGRLRYRRVVGRARLWVESSASGHAASADRS